MYYFASQQQVWGRFIRGDLTSGCLLLLYNSIGFMHVVYTSLRASWTKFGVCSWNDWKSTRNCAPQFKKVVRHWCPHLGFCVIRTLQLRVVYKNKNTYNMYKYIIYKQRVLYRQDIMLCAYNTRDDGVAPDIKQVHWFHPRLWCILREIRRPSFVEVRL